ncbi:MAG TPA: hypothetical protein VNW52_10190, partial [Burkholderiaceae bacterium]|nr:hypothetical protein [Burkholderiaceae bacterium]
DKILAAELADSLSWVGSTKETIGELSDALALYERELQIAKKLYEASPIDALWANRVSLGLQHRGELELALGQDGNALADYRQSKKIFDTIIEKEPSNRVWQSSRALAQLEELKILTYQGQAKNVLPVLEKVTTEISSLTLVDPKRASWRLLEAIAHRNSASALLDLHRIEEAKREINASLSNIETLHSNNKSALHSREAFAAMLIVAAEIDIADSDVTAARAVCEKVGELIGADAASSSDFRILDPWVRSQLCLGKTNVVVNAKSDLSKMGYREFAYMRSISQSK